MKAQIQDQSLKELLQRTPAGRDIIKSITLSGNYDEFLGKGFFKKLGKKIKGGLRKVGKVTSPITTRIAKVGASFIGVPPTAIDRLAKADPTAHKKLVASINKSSAGKKAKKAITKSQALAKKAGFGEVKPIYVIAGAGALAAAVIVVAATKKK